MKLNSTLLLLFAFAFGAFVSAQSERKITRKGNTQYDTGDFVEAEINYKKAIAKNSNLLEAQFNLGDALAKQERFEEAIASFDLVSATSEDETLKADALHNKGNVLLQQQDLEGAVESYKEALRINPKDHQTRYNYAYAKNALEQQQQQEQEQNEDNEDENKEDKDGNQENKEKGDQKNEDSENQDQEKSEDENKENKEEQQDKGENKEDESEKEQKDKGQTDGDESDEEKQEPQQKPAENKLSPEEAQRLLEALKQEENKVQAKMKKHKIKGAKVKIEKDW
jgi:Ca-activated chloride channel family protein|tara:strand:- start:3446 stop:4291 length:846 start_codon:yes stop_codon:yes gene_type:complete